MTARTPESAAELLCPCARTFASPKAKEGCCGPVCAVWRWHPLPAGLLLPHIAARLAEQGGKDHKAATAWVMENREALGIPTAPTHGFCGMGGQP